MVELKPGFNIIIGGQWGSEGKGKVAGALADQAKVVVTDCMPNAGHTFWEGDTKHVSKCVPAATVLHDIPCFIAPGAVLSRASFRQEILKAKGPVYIHANTAVVEDTDRSAEEALVKSIASTGQGAGAALARKIGRHNATVASSIPELEQYVLPPGGWIHRLRTYLAEPILVETGQGFGLSLDSRWFPHCTSRNVNVPAILDRIGGWREEHVAQVIGVIRTYPIRVGHVYDKEGDVVGDSGGHFIDQKETSWSELGLRPEITTVTKRVRRVFGFSWDQLREFLGMCNPDHLVVNFMDYLNPESAAEFQTALGYWQPVIYSDNPFDLEDRGIRL